MADIASAETGTVSGGLRTLLRLEGLTLFAGMTLWLAHIGIDRALGYGLKYATGFSYTHLGRIGKDATT